MPRGYPKDGSTSGPKPRSEAERFWEKVAKTETCWLWTASTSVGYGVFGIRSPRRTMLAHRYAYETLVGPIPDGLQLDHLCRVRHCVNPAHLEPVTQRENLRRGEGPAANHARQTHCVRGHEFTEANTHKLPSGGRSCRLCDRIRGAEKRARRRAGIAPLKLGQRYPKPNA